MAGQYEKLPEHLRKIQLKWQDRWIRYNNSEELISNSYDLLLKYRKHLPEELAGLVDRGMAWYGPEEKLENLFEDIKKSKKELLRWKKVVDSAREDRLFEDVLPAISNNGKKLRKYSWLMDGAHSRDDHEFQDILLKEIAETPEGVLKEHRQLLEYAANNSPSNETVWNVLEYLKQRGKPAEGDMPIFKAIIEGPQISFEERDPFYHKYIGSYNPFELATTDIEKFLEMSSKSYVKELVGLGKNVELYNKRVEPNIGLHKYYVNAFIKHCDEAGLRPPFYKKLVELRGKTARLHDKRERMR